MKKPTKLTKEGEDESEGSPVIKCEESAGKWPNRTQRLSGIHLCLSLGLRAVHHSCMEVEEEEKEESEKEPRMMSRKNSLHLNLLSS